jgi:16S rRNA uridine-516 pseudouridylate synthase and related pseudouridylate synthases
MDEIHADAISYTDDFKKDQVGIEIHSGKNRIVRRIFESLGYKVVKLDRVFFAGLTKKVCVAETGVICRKQK